MARKKTTLPKPESFIGPETDNAKTYYTTTLWKGVRKVYVCLTCSHNEDDEGDMQLHVLDHFPEGQREAILNEMLKGEMKHG